MTGTTSWVDICPFDALTADRGVAALVGGDAVAVFRLAGDELHAIDHTEPFTGTPVLARGLVGSSGEIPTVASPLHKQRFDLRTGRCLDDPDHSVRVWPVRVEAGVVQVARLPAVEQGTGLGHSGSNGHLNGHLNGQSNGLNGHGTGAERAVDPTGDRHMLTETDVKLVQDSFAEVLPIADEAAAMFYERLFEIAPEVQPLFSSDLTEQRRKLMMTIGIVVSGLHEYDELEEVVRQLGGRHAFDYGARPEHYPLVGEALLWTLGQGLGPAFTAELEAAWSAAYEMVTQTMLSAADDAVR